MRRDRDKIDTRMKSGRDKKIDTKIKKGRVEMRKLTQG